MTSQKILFYSALVFIFILAVLPDPSRLPDFTRISDKLNHFLSFLILAVLIDLAYPGVSMLRKCMFLGGYGLLIEIVQALFPYRHFSPGDLAADAAAVLAYLMIRKRKRSV